MSIVEVAAFNQEARSLQTEEGGEQTEQWVKAGVLQHLGQDKKTELS